MEKDCVVVVSQIKMLKRRKSPSKIKLKQFLANHGLSPLLDKLKKMGVEQIDDLQYLKEEDMVKNGFTVIQRNKLQAAIDEMGTESGDEDNAPNAPSSGPAASSPKPKQKQRNGSSKKDTGSSKKDTKTSTMRSSTGHVSGGGGETFDVFARHDFTKIKDAHLSFKKGDKFIILDRRKAWWQAQDKDGNIGLVPSNYMEEIKMSSGGKRIPAPIPSDLYQSRKQAVAADSDSETESGGLIDPTKGYEDPDDFRKAGAGKISRPRPEEVKIVPKTKALPEDPRVWNSGEVKRWLKENDLSDFVDVFYANGFEGDKIMDLTGEAFKSSQFPADRCDFLEKNLAHIRNGKYTGPLKKSKEDTEKRVKVLYEFNALKREHLSIKEEEILVILDDSGPWWKAKNSKGDTGLVPSNYIEVIQGAGVGQKKLEDHKWFHPGLDRKASEEVVSRDGPGAFVVRPSRSKPGSFTLTVCGAGGRVMNLLIKRLDSGGYVLGEFGSEFKTVGDVIDHYQEHEMKVEGKPGIFLTKG